MVVRVKGVECRHKGNRVLLLQIMVDGEGQKRRKCYGQNAQIPGSRGGKLKPENTSQTEENSGSGFHTHNFDTSIWRDLRISTVGKLQ